MHFYWSLLLYYEVISLLDEWHHFACGCVHDGIHPWYGLRGLMLSKWLSNFCGLRSWIKLYLRLMSMHYTLQLMPY